MFYEPGKTPHNLPFDPFKACVVPRPIGWISTTSPLPPTTRDTPYPPPPPPPPQHNLAPYSQFANLTFDPPYVMFAANQKADGSRKDTVRNAEATGKFVVNMATHALRAAVNASAQQLPYGADEFAAAGLAKAFSRCLPGDGDGGNPVPVVRDSPVRLECVHHATWRLPGNPPLGSADVVVGRVVGVYIADWAIDPASGRLDLARVRPIARCGYYDYAVVNDTFEMIIPGLDEATLAGLEGSRARVEKLGLGSKL
ncbi:hypothetical protein B0T26DRAFT_840105 [Lasiosphaeria miniovina]|uniref:Flavin reductase like domain-containing protein n=1 Tax=Lasiosphaeria miniovina TaxID=1954250 RepID=A0AA39ZUH2_9PEZI|nr:uncharacterized protein B0T26DRAFT_840105 [Lasiosphaeria miniovina]KAK0703966.1 hypothetical protein B0T26DRAFT_840105 [Lasiosphaeria miniovina]